MNDDRYINLAQHKSNLFLQFQCINKSLVYTYFRGATSTDRVEITAFLVSDHQDKIFTLKQQLEIIGFTHLETKEEENLVYSQYIKPEQNLDLSAFLSLTQTLAELAYKFDVKFKGFALRSPPLQNADLDGEWSIQDWLDHAKQLSREARHDEAEVIYEWLLSLEPNSTSIRFERAFQRQARGDWIGAIDDMEILVQISPESESNWCILGESYIVTNEYDKAIESFTKAIELDPDDFTYYHYRAKVLFYLGRIDEACIDWAKTKLLGDDFWAPQYLKHRFMKMD